MIQKGTSLIPIDKNGVWSVGVFHLYGGFFKKNASSGSFLKTSVKRIRSSLWLSKKSKVKAITILTKKEINYNSCFYFKFKNNSCVLLKKRLSSYGQDILGPSIKSIRRKKFIYSFSGIL